MNPVRTVASGCLAALLLLHLGLAQTNTRKRIHGNEDFAAEPSTLWYASPAHVWTDALAVGNGRLGAMIFGDPEKDKLQLNDITIWSGGPMPNADRPGAYKALPAIREALSKGDYATAQTLVKDNMTTVGKGDSEYWPSYETLGDLNFDCALGSGDVTNYARWLNIQTAVSGIDFTVDGVTYHREIFSSAPAHAIVAHLTADHPGKITFMLALSRIASATTTALGNDSLVMKGDSTYPAQPARPANPNLPGSWGAARGPMAPRPGNVDYEAQVHVQTVGGSVTAEGSILMVWYAAGLTAGEMIASIL